MDDLVVSNARVFDGTKLLDQLQSVGIVKGRITFVGPTATPPARKEIDAAGRFLMPGLVLARVAALAEEITVRQIIRGPWPPVFGPAGLRR